MNTVRTSSNYYIPPGKFLLVENALGNPDLIQTSLSSDCQVTIIDKSNFPLDELEQWPVFNLRTADIKLKGGSGLYYIYIVVPLPDNTAQSDAIIGYSTKVIDKEGYEILSDGTKGELVGNQGFIYYSAGTVGAQGSDPEAVTTPQGKGRTLQMDLGTTPPIASLPEDFSDYDKIFEIDKVDPSNPKSWILTIIATIQSLTARVINVTQSLTANVINVTEKLVFKFGDEIHEITDVAVASDKGDKKKVADTTVASTAWVYAEFESLDDKYLHKDQPDKTDYLVEFLAGLRSGKFVDSLIAGMGAGIFPDGRGQFSRLEVREALVVMRLIINEIQAMSGDFSFSDCGTIEKVELLDDGTYRLTMEKRTDTDWTNLDENDVMLSIVNTLLTGGNDYYTSWFRCITKNRNDNTLTVVLYPDKEVPGGKNYPPVAGYNVTRRGNAMVPDTGEAPNERAQSWLLSSREGRIMFLQNVYKPILEDYNYALTLGRFPNVKMIEKLPIGPTDVGVMSKIGVFEKIYEADWNGTIIPKKVDRGEWSLATAQGDEPYRFVDYETQLENQKVITTLEQHTVYHYGCKWGCLIDKTTEEPQWNSAGWTLLEGDKNYHLDFTSTAGWQFFKNGVNTDIAAVVSYANRDITNVLMATTGVEVEWLRDTGNVPADNSWSPTYVDDQKHVIRLTSADMGSEWGFTVRTVKFICRVFIPVGEDMETVENYVGFRI